MSESPTRFVGNTSNKIKNFLKRMSEKKLKQITIRINRPYIQEPKTVQPMKYGRPSPQEIVDIIHSLKGKEPHALFANVIVNTIDYEEQQPVLTSPGRWISRANRRSKSASSNTRSPTPRSRSPSPRMRSPKRNHSPKYDKYYSSRRPRSVTPKHNHKSKSRSRSRSPRRHYSREKDYGKSKDEYEARSSKKSSSYKGRARSRSKERRSRSRSPRDKYDSKHRTRRSKSPAHRDSDCKRSDRDKYPEKHSHVKEPPLRPGEFRGPSYRPEKDPYKHYSSSSYRKRSRSRSYDGKRKSASPHCSRRSRTPHRRHSSSRRSRSRSLKRRSHSSERSKNYHSMDPCQEIPYGPPREYENMHHVDEYWYPGPPRFFPRLPIHPQVAMPPVMFRPMGPYLMPVQPYPPPRFRHRPPIQYNNRRVPTVENTTPSHTETSNDTNNSQQIVVVSVQEPQPQNEVKIQEVNDEKESTKS